MTDAHQTTFLQSIAKTRDTAVAAYNHAVDKKAPQQDINNLKSAMLDAQQAYADAISKTLNDNRATTLSIQKQLDDATDNANTSIKSLESISNIITKIKIAVDLAILLAKILL